MAQGTESTERIFDRETLLDLTVNFIPLGIILFFTIMFPIYNYFVDPFGSDIVASTIMIALHVIPFVALAILTYFSGKVITEAERQGESGTAEAVSSSVMDDDDLTDMTELPDDAENDREENTTAALTDRRGGTESEDDAETAEATANTGSANGADGENDAE